MVEMIHEYLEEAIACNEIPMNEDEKKELADKIRGEYGDKIREELREKVLKYVQKNYVDLEYAKENKEKVKLSRDTMAVSTINIGMQTVFDGKIDGKYGRVKLGSILCEKEIMCIMEDTIMQVVKDGYISEKHYEGAYEYHECYEIIWVRGKKAEKRRRLIEIVKDIIIEIIEGIG